MIIEAERVESIKANGMAASGNEQSIIVKVPVQMLGDSSGIVAADVMTDNGAMILPAGVDITFFESNIEDLIKKMEAHGISHVLIQETQQLSDEDLEEIIENVYSAGETLISKEKASDIVKGIDTLFHSISENEISPEMINSVVNMGSDITEDILKQPSVAFSLGRVREADEYTFVHSFNVAVLAGFLASKLFFDRKDFIQKVITGGLLHDMGKAKISPAVLNKPGALDQNEFKEMKRHPVLGMMLAMNSGVRDEEILAVIGCHHEKWSGKGYPMGRRGMDIPLSARITAVADVFDALTAKRVYKNPMSSRNAISIILKDAGVHFDVSIARELLVSLGLYPPGSIVGLSDGRTGIVVSGSGKDLIRPVVMIKHLQKNDGMNAPTFIDLKTAGDLRILSYLGHAEKRELGYSL
ncbi:MAG: HD-GYP domain-containing protein [Synergistaceae bacterium]|nr:HD-GYP domain-containing protein [Synergistaceae bacterium]